MGSIDVGLSGVPSGSVSSLGGEAVLISAENPSNGAGVITSVQLLFDEGGTAQNLEVGTFFGSGGSLTTRDSVNLGSVSVGTSIQTVSGLSIEIGSGDLIGCRFDAGVWIRIGLEDSGYIKNSMASIPSSGNYSSCDVSPAIYGTGVTFDPPTVSTNSVSSIQDTSAVCGGNVTDDGGATVTARGICYNTSGSPTTSSPKVTAGSGIGSFSRTMTGLARNQTYYVRAYAQNSEGTTYGPQRSFTTLKGTQSAPSAPTLSSRTDTSITLNAISGCEYKRGSGAWQSSTTFSGLSRNATYTFYARKAETSTYYASASSSGSNLTTLKGTQSAPSAPTLASRTDTSITLNSISGCEYKMDSGSWQSSTTFSGLGNNTTHTFYARKAETSTYYASDSSSGTALTTLKGSQSAPSAPTMSARTATSITLNEITGYEYMMDSGSWQDSPIFEGLSYATTHTFYARKKETSTLYASASSSGADFTSLKGSQSPPATPTLSTRTATSITLNEIAACEYMMDSGSWQASTLFEGLEYNSTHTFYARKAETSTLYASDPSNGAGLTTLKGNQAAPEAPTMDSHTETSVTLNEITGCEYKVGEGAWQDSVLFEGLSFATSYTFYARKKETSTLYASDSSVGADLMTLKGTQSAPSAPTMSAKTFTSIALNEITGCEYKMGAGDWQDSPTFTGLDYYTEYTFYARKKETSTLYASDPSAGGALITAGWPGKIEGLPNPSEIVKVGIPDIAEIAGVEK